MFSQHSGYFHETHLVEHSARSLKKCGQEPPLDEYARFLYLEDERMKRQRLAEVLSKLKEFRIHTGNINQWAELKQKRFENSAEELTECLKLELDQWVPSEQQLAEARESGKVTLCENPECQPCVVSEIGARDNLSVTLKIFLSGLCPIQARRCLESVLTELKTGHVERLIVALTIRLNDEYDSEEAEGEAWVDGFWPLWLQLQELVKEGTVKELGVADLELSQLRALVQRSQNEGIAKPAINHYNIQNCCTVPEDLQEYARAEKVKLLTHNDPKPFCTDSKLQEVCCTHLGLPNCPLPGSVKWVARYAVMIVSRSVMTAKGFVVDFGTCEKSTGPP